jgi:hypothetical protein
MNTKITAFCYVTLCALTISVTERLALNSTHLLLIMCMLKVTEDNLIS